VIYLAKNPTFHARTKHIDVWYHFVHDMVEDGKVILEKIDTLKNVADALRNLWAQISLDGVRSLWASWPLAVKSCHSIGS